MSITITADMTKKALEKLKEGNKKYLDSGKMTGDVSPAIRSDTAEHGQSPYAVVITCSDSRVIPEAVFSAGIGELFTIRVAGNIIGGNQLASIEYAVEHLGSAVVLVLGHTSCGAVGAAMEGGAGGYIKEITDEIKKAIGAEADPYEASRLNVAASVKKILNAFDEGKDKESLIHSGMVIGAIYDIKSGEVKWL